MRRLIHKALGGSERSQVVKKNIFGSFAIKGAGILTSLLLVPLTIKLLDQEKYGIWITIFSIVSWFNMMDVGLGNGFRNKFAEALALNNKGLAKEYVQTLYSSMGLISFGFFLIFSGLNNFLNWRIILNLPDSFDENINLIFWLVFSLFCFQLYLKNISVILLALQKTSLSNLLTLLGNLSALLFIFVLQITNNISLLTIALAFMIAPVLVQVSYTLFFLGYRLNYLKPKIFRLPQKKYFDDMVGLGLKFFFIQITTIIMFSSSNIIISQLFGPKEVTPYNVAFRLFSAVMTIFTIIVTPFWSAFTEANAKNDISWIKRSITNLIKVWGVFLVGIIVLWILSPFVFKIWIGKEVEVPYTLSVQFAIYVALLSWTSLFVNYVNGVGVIRLQLIIAIAQSVIYIPLAILLVKFLNLNTAGVIMATNISLLLPAILIPIQYKKLINKTSYGIWAR